MRMVRVKICGITSKRDLKAAVEAGADAVGFVVEVDYSPRSLSLEEAQKLVDLVPLFVDSVAVTTTESIEGLKRIYKRLRPDGIQIHCDKLPEACEAREYLSFTRLIKVLHPELCSEESSLENAQSFDAVLLDSHIKGRQGGTGKPHDWELSRKIKEKLNPTPVILAGGLNSENIGKAIRAVRPYGVDVSSGVESYPGVKDPLKVFEFIRKAKEAAF